MVRLDCCIFGCVDSLRALAGAAAAPCLNAM
jgi:hypothetical protein